MKIETDLVVFNGNIITMDPQKPTASALAVKCYKILAIGEEEEVVELIPNSKRVIDLGGKTVIPGFIDAHTHLTSAGVKAAHVQLGKVGSLEEAVQFLTDAVSKYPKGEWILGYEWDESTWTEKRFIESKDLDPISKDHPIMATRVCGHLASVNSLGLKKLGISLKQEGVQRDRLGRRRKGLRQHSIRTYPIENSSGLMHLVFLSVPLSVRRIRIKLFLKPGD